MEYLTVKETGEKWGITSRMVNVYCSNGRIPGAKKRKSLAGSRRCGKANR
jgi:DNA-binding CsgD family transcriptional regulator